MALRVHFLTAVVSVLSGLVVFFLFRSFMIPEIREGYAVVAVDASLSDRHVRDLLGSAGFPDGCFSESNQWVYIDDFGDLKKIPLDIYQEEVELFDPRNDGFGERLKGFFVRNGKRFFFIPLEGGFGGRKKLEKALASAMDQIPFSVEILGYSRPFFWYFVLSALAALGALFLSGFSRGFAFQIAVLLAFARGGPPALVLAGLLASFWALSRDPLEELFSARRYRFASYAGRGIGALQEKLRPYRLNLILVFVFLLLFVFAAGIGGLSPLPVWIGFFSSWGLIVLSRASESERERRTGHVRFTPVIMGPAKTLPLFPVAAVFAAAALLSLLLPLAFPSFAYPSPSGLLPLSDRGYVISAAEYEQHAALARSFSLRPLGAGLRYPDSVSGGYSRYYLGEDGLIAGETEDPLKELRAREIPSFPLEKLMEFLLEYNNRAGKTAPAQFKEWIVAGLLVAACVPAFFLRRKKRRNKA
ncbi:MAG: hypothetical protein LBS57_06550 [Treponema sp.]|nr:hypothetical protein [Treponema sp.]